MIIYQLYYHEIEMTLAVTIAYQPTLTKTLEDKGSRYGHYSLSSQFIHGIHLALRTVFTKDINQHFLLICNGEPFDFDCVPSPCKVVSKTRSFVVNNCKIITTSDDACQGLLTVCSWLDTTVTSDTTKWTLS